MTKEKEKKKRRIIPDEEKKYTCDICGKKISNPWAMRNHFRFKHPEEFVTRYPATPKEGGGAGKGNSFRRGEGEREGENRGGSDSREGEKDDSFGGWVPL